MPSPTLDDTLGGASSNSYIDVAGAGAYFANLMSFDAWDGLTDDDLRERALISATAALEELEFWGTPVSADQALAFPRYFAGESDGLSIPKRILDACCELALDLATRSPDSSATSRAALIAGGVLAWKIGDAGETLSGGGGAGNAQAALQEMPARVQRLVSGWVKSVHQIDSGRRRLANGNYDANGLWWPSELM